MHTVGKSRLTEQTGQSCVRDLSAFWPQVPSQDVRAGLLFPQHVPLPTLLPTKWCQLGAKLCEAKDWAHISKYQHLPLLFPR